MKYDALMLTGFGGPEGPDDVWPFLERVAAGRGIPKERLSAVAEHYLALGGVSPINTEHRELLAQLRERVGDIPFLLGNRKSAPFIVDTLRELRAGGAERVLAIATTPWVSYASCRQYRENIADAIAELGDDAPEVDMLSPYRDVQGVKNANLSLVRTALNRNPDAHVIFTSHSIPVAMDSVSGVHGRYAREQRGVAAQVVEALREEHRPVTWTFAYQSRSGSPATPWLEPDINDHLRFMAGQGVRSVIVVPIGFLSDHMEVIWDLDHEAATTAAEMGMDFHRVPTIGRHPQFLDSLGARITAILASGQPSRQLCGPLCCPNARENHPAVQGVSL